MMEKKLKQFKRWDIKLEKEPGDNLVYISQAAERSEEDDMIVLEAEMIPEFIELLKSLTPNRSMKEMKVSRSRRNRFRPKRIVIGFYCSYTNNFLGCMDAPYEPLKMLRGFYRKYIENWKRVVAPTYKKEGMLHGKTNTIIDFKY